MSASAIRAGKAFVELLIRDETVQASLDAVKAKLQSFGTAVDTVGSASFTRMNVVATSSLASTGSAVGVLGAGMGVLNAAVYMVGNAFRVTFNYATTSVTKVILGVGLLAMAISRFAPKTGFITKILDGFLSRSQTTEAIGRWTRFFGMLTGSSVIRSLGNQIERLGLGSAVVAGFRKSGVIGGISATLGAAFRASQSIVASGLVGLFSAPISVVRRMLGTVVPSGVAGLFGAAPATSAIASGLNQATTAARTFGATSSVFASVGTSIRALLVRVGGLTAILTGPALLAARRFATASEEIIAASKKTGDEFVSIEEGIRRRFGNSSLVSKADIEAGAALNSVMAELKQASAAAWAQVGIAALPVLQALTEKSLWAANAVTQLLGRNRDLLGSIISLAAKVGTAAAAGLSLYVIFPYIAAGIGLVLSPLGLLAGAVIAAAVAFPQLREEAGGVVEFLTGNFPELGQIVETTMSGIADALAGGNLEVATRVMWAGLNVAWLAGTEQLRSVWRNMQTSIAAMWINFWAAIEQAGVTAMNSFMSTLRSTQNAVAGGFARAIAYFTGQDVNEVLATLAEMQNAEAAGTEDAFKKRLEGIEAARQATLESLDEEAAARARMADQKLQDARAELQSARESAAAAKPKKNANTDPTVKAELGTATSLGTFSVAALGRQSIGGLAGLQKASEATAQNTAETVAAIRSLQMNWA